MFQPVFILSKYLSEQKMNLFGYLKSNWWPENISVKNFKIFLFIKMKVFL